MELTISLGQMDVKLGDPEHNLKVVEEMTAEAARRGSDLIVFPELWSTGYDLENAAQHAAPVGQGIFAQVSGLAKQHNIAILGSCLSTLRPGEYGNTAVFIEPDGSVLGSYTKTHLFGPMEESVYLTPGDSLTLVETRWGKAGLAICYDLRFPEVFRAYALAGAKIVFLPAEWPYPRIKHWRTLLRARAIENQFYVAACNRVGESKGYDFLGHSCLIDPSGEAVIEAGENENLLTAVIQMDKVDQARAKMPVFEDRRPEVYDGERSLAKSAE